MPFSYQRSCLKVRRRVTRCQYVPKLDVLVAEIGQEGGCREGSSVCMKMLVHLYPLK